MRPVTAQIEESRKGLSQSLLKYANDRNPGWFVGQFLDDDGRNNQQHGIYGMSAWLCITKDLEDPRVKNLREVCQNQLCAWVQAAKHSQVANLALAPESPEYEVRWVAPKAAAALEALAQEPEATVEVRYLLDFLLAGRRGDHLWGFMLDASTASDLRATAMILRSVSVSKPDKGWQELIDQSLGAVAAEVENVRDSLYRLYILSTIVSLSSNRRRSADSRKMMAKDIAHIYSKNRSQPTAYAKPLNIDFHDLTRMREIRLPADAVFLEGLLLLSGKYHTIVEIGIGRQVCDKLTMCLAHVPLNVDTSNDRASISTVLFSQRVLEAVAKEATSSVPSSVRRCLGWFAWKWIEPRTKVLLVLIVLFAIIVTVRGGSLWGVVIAAVLSSLVAPAAAWFFGLMVTTSGKASE